MTTIENAKDLIRMSVREDRTVTEYPDTREQETALLDDLMSADGYEDSADVSGSGYSGDEARGYTDLWGDTWRVHVVHAAVA